MKQISIALNVVLSSLLVFFACNTNKQSSSSTDPVTTVETQDSAKLCYNCAGDHFALDITHFYSDLRRYRQTHYALYNHYRETQGAPGFQDARSCWFSLDTLQKFLCLFRHYTDSTSCIGASHFLSSHDLGLKFYYAVYDSGVTSEGYDYGYHHTLVIVPAYKNDRNELIDFDARTSCQSGNIVPLNKLSASSQFFGLGGSQVTATAGNQGQLCPPKCPTNDPTLTAVDTY